MKFSRSRSAAGEMPFLDHLEELRWRILWSLLALVIGAAVGFFLVTRLDVLGLLIAPIEPLLGTSRLKYLSPTDPFFITLRLALLIGGLLALPVIVYQIWSFVSPALLPREKRSIVPALYMGLVLFLAGVALAYFVALPTALRFMMGFQVESLEQSIVVGAYMSFVVRLLLAFGLVFELPVVVLLLAVMGVVDARMLSAGRRYALVAITIVASLITPGDFIMLTLFLMIPLALLYELSIGLAKLVERRRSRALAEEKAAAEASRGVSWTLAVLLAGGLLAAAAPAAAQEPRLPEDSVRVKVLERLRTLKPGRDAPAATPAAPEAQARAAGDSARRTPAPQAPTPAAPAAADSILQALLRLDGFAATEYEGTAATFASDSARIDLTGKARVTRAGNTMTADSLLTYELGSAVACGYGAPVLTGQGTTSPVESEQVCYDVDRQLGVARDARTEFSQGANWFIRGDLYTAGTDRIYGHDAAFTSCDLEVPHWHFNAGEVKVVADRVLVARNVTLNFADVPVFWLPFMMQSMERGRRSGLLTPRFSINDIARTSSNYQRRLSDIGFYWAINDYLGARMSLDWFSGSWTALQGDLQYRWLDQFLNGSMAFSHYWREGGRRDLTLRGGTSWRFDERTDLVADVNYASSSDFVRRNTFDPRELRRNNIGSNASLNRRFDWGSMNLGARRQQYLSDDRIEYTFPSVSLSLSPVTLFEAPSSGASWYNNATWTANGSMNARGTDVPDTLRSARSQRGLDSRFSSSLSLGSLSWGQSFSLDERVDLARPALEADTALPRSERRQMSWSTSLGYQQRLIGTSSITPSLSWSGGMESSAASGGQLVARPSRFDFGTSLSTDLYGFWPGVGPFNRIRHRLSPSLSYRYSPALTATPQQRELFNIDQLREQNALTISLNQTIEAKYEDSDTAATPADTAAADPAGGPRRRPQARKATLLSLTTSAIAYDWAATDGPGFTTDQITQTLNSDLLRGLQLSFTHDLFEGTGDSRNFAPSLTNLSTSFSLNSRSAIFRLLGLARDAEEEPPPADSAAADGTRPDDLTAQGGDPRLDLIGGRAPSSAYEGGSTGIGEWSANLRYTYYRPRLEGTAVTDTQANQMLQGSVSFRPTGNWNVHWNTAYSLTHNEFSDHILTLTRDLHRWQANFDFVKAQNGNFSFQFRVTLLDNPDLKLDYEQRGRSPVRGF